MSRPSRNPQPGVVHPAEVARTIIASDSLAVTPPREWEAAPADESTAAGSSFQLIEFHPLADVFPLMEGQEFADLVADIKEHKLREPITLYQEKILDGRNRYRGCMAGDVEPRFETYEGDNPLAFVISVNLRRRHLNESQRAMIALRLANMRQGERTDLEPSATLQKVSRKMAAKLLNVSERSVAHAAAVRDTGERALVAAVERGKLTVSAAATLAKAVPELQRSVVSKIEAGERPTEALRQAKREALPTSIATWPRGIYRVLYADPAWRYNDARHVGKSTGALDHYADMSLDELARLKVSDIAAPDSVLFCWATFPLLRDAIDLTEKWGFTFKTSFIWDKGHGAFGNYHDAEAELLLVCTRGSCTPDADTREKQIQRFPPGRHSEKPEEFRALIDRLYRIGPRIELFRRGGAPPGWDVWGAEAIPEDAE